MLTERQTRLLRLITGDYIRYGLPVASEALVRNHDVGVSSATIRNEVAELEEAGYITRPHPSAGSVPSDRAYRVFVGSLPTPTADEFPRRVEAEVRRSLQNAYLRVEDWASAAAAILAGLVGNMAVTTLPRAVEARVKHLELVHLQDFVALLIVVLEQAHLRRQLVRLRDAAAPEEMERVAQRLRKRLLGLSRREIHELEPQTFPTPIEEDLVSATMHVLAEEERDIYREHYVDGLRNLLSQPEFADAGRARALVEGVEEGTLAHAVLEERPAGTSVGVVIGAENQEEMLAPFSVVICQYGIVGEAVGVVSAVGPTRMDYARTIASVSLMVSAMTEIVEGARSP